MTSCRDQPSVTHMHMFWTVSSVHSIRTHFMLVLQISPVPLPPVVEALMHIHHLACCKPIE